MMLSDLSRVKKTGDRRLRYDARLSHARANRGVSDACSRGAKGEGTVAIRSARG
jgi:hypothetical protein